MWCSLLQRMDKTQSCLHSVFFQIVGNGLVNILNGRYGNDQLDLHFNPYAPALAALRTRSRKPSK